MSSIFLEKEGTNIAQICWKKKKTYKNNIRTSSLMKRLRFTWPACTWSVHTQRTAMVRCRYAVTAPGTAALLHRESKPSQLSCYSTTYLALSTLNFKKMNNSNKINLQWLCSSGRLLLTCMPYEQQAHKVLITLHVSKHHLTKSCFLGFSDRSSELKYWLT